MIKLKLNVLIYDILTCVYNKFVMLYNVIWDLTCSGLVPLTCNVY